MLLSLFPQNSPGNTYGGREIRRIPSQAWQLYDGRGPEAGCQPGSCDEGLSAADGETPAVPQAAMSWVKLEALPPGAERPFLRDYLVLFCPSNSSACCPGPTDLPRSVKRRSQQYLHHRIIVKMIRNTAPLHSAWCLLSNIHSVHTSC